MHFLFGPIVQDAAQSKNIFFKRFYFKRDKIALGFHRNLLRYPYTLYIIIYKHSFAQIKNLRNYIVI